MSVTCSIISSGESNPWMRAKAGFRLSGRPPGAIWKMPSVALRNILRYFVSLFRRLLRPLRDQLLQVFLLLQQPPLDLAALGQVPYGGYAQPAAFGLHLAGANGYGELAPVLFLAYALEPSLFAVADALLRIAARVMRKNVREGPAAQLSVLVCEKLVEPGVAADDQAVLDKDGGLKECLDKVPEPPITSRPPGAFIFFTELSPVRVLPTLLRSVRSLMEDTRSRRPFGLHLAGADGYRELTPVLFLAYALEPPLFAVFDALLRVGARVRRNKVRERACRAALRPCMRKARTAWRCRR